MSRRETYRLEQLPEIGKYFYRAVRWRLRSLKGRTVIKMPYVRNSRIRLTR